MAEATYCDFYGSYAKIYTLSDCNGNVFYVGCTINKMEVRIKQHLCEAKHNRGNKRKNAIIQKLDYKVVFTIVDMKWVTGRVRRWIKRGACDLEQEWIKKYQSLGYELCNGREITIVKTKDVVKEFIGQSFSVTSSSDHSAFNIDESWEQKPAKA